MQDDVDPTKWLVSYDVTVTSGGYDTFYSLSDTPAFAPSLTLGAGTAQRTDIAAQPVLTITSGTDFVTDVALPAGATHVYRVTWQATDHGRRSRSIRRGAPASPAAVCSTRRR